MEWMNQDEDLHYLNEQDEFWLATFLEAGIRFLPHLKREHLAPGQVGYRPKIQKEGEGLTDFLIWKDEGYIHLGGIESPGLTASLPIADQVAYLIN
jgi:L-2-hydroxyglutarate oxidase LhgO